MAPMDKLKCASFLKIYVLYIGAKIKTLRKNVLKRKIFVFIFASKFQKIKYYPQGPNILLHTFIFILKNIKTFK